MKSKIYKSKVSVLSKNILKIKSLIMKQNRSVRLLNHQTKMIFYESKWNRLEYVNNSLILNQFVFLSSILPITGYRV